MAIIKPDYWYPNPIDPSLLINPLEDCEWIPEIDNPLAEVALLSFYSLPWACKYILNTEVAPFQSAFLYMLWNKKYPILLASRGASKTFTLAVYAILRALFDQGSKVIIVSASFRQAKRVFEEIKAIYKRAPLLRQCTKSVPKQSIDHCIYEVGDSVIKALPLGNGEKIRGERASHVLIDEVDSVDPEVFHVVIRGFAATQLRPIDKIKEAAQKKERKRRPNEGNQIVIAGTAGFTGDNFHKMYTQYLKIIDNRICGPAYKYADILGEDYGDMHIDWRDYGIIELPWYKVPEGMLDRDLISHARMTMSEMLFNMEYCCKFADTSRGFFKYESIEGATLRGSEAFSVQAKGSPKSQYVMGVDPARTSDAFAIVILEVADRLKVRYCYTAINEKFSYNVDKILELMDKFNIVRIGIDAGGGGLTVEEMLQSVKDRLPLYRIDDRDPSKEGLYILDMINFTPNWIEEANFLLQKNIEDRRLVFPLLTDETYKHDNIEELEHIYEEIRECKKELLQITVTQTKSGLRHFDIAPSMEAKKRGVKPRKDRYSALLIANWVACHLDDNRQEEEKLKAWRDCIGGWAEEFL
ncbi:MAG: hypothetical protein DRP85_00720 [Candidatus Makaraimicrobium thalassicum]|nr:MAG: hypothetical protein DRP85_00720 [Candidatus Omnitrophota bacterium]